MIELKLPGGGVTPLAVAAISARRLCVALAFAVVNVGAAAADEGRDDDFVGVATESLCFGALENRTRPSVWVAQRAAENGFVQIDRRQLPAAGGVGWRSPSDVYVIDHGFGTCAINVAADRAGAREAMLAAVSSHLPMLENLTSRGIAQEGVTDLFCGDRPFGSVYAFVTTSESPAGPRLVLMIGVDRQSCADGMRFFLGTMPPT